MTGSEEARRMQPIVRADEKHFDRQTHAYAEFRLFSRLGADRGVVASVMMLERSGTTTDSRTLCRITVMTSDGETLRIDASEPHPYAAIDRAVDDVARVLRWRGRDRAGASHETA
jgi:ribosome-associated translation inhibitor RaiA